MTKEDIKTAITICTSQISCADCPYRTTYRDCGMRLMRDVLDLISEQEAGIERLNERFAEYKKPISKFIEDRERKAVQDFAENLKKRAFQGYDIGMYIVNTEMIDELLKEYTK